MSEKTTDEQLAKLRTRYPERIIGVTERMVNRDSWEQEGFVATAHTAMERMWHGGRICDMGDVGIAMIRPTEAEALDALAEALAKLEGGCPKCKHVSEPQSERGK